MRYIVPLTGFRSVAFETVTVFFVIDDGPFSSFQERSSTRQRDRPRLVSCKLWNPA